MNGRLLLLVLPMHSSLSEVGVSAWMPLRIVGAAEQVELMHLVVLTWLKFMETSSVSLESFAGAEKVRCIVEAQT